MRLTLGKRKNKYLSLCSCPSSLQVVNTVILYESPIIYLKFQSFHKAFPPPPPSGCRKSFLLSESSTALPRLLCNWLGQHPFPPLMGNWDLCCPTTLTSPSTDSEYHPQPCPLSQSYKDCQALKIKRSSRCLSKHQPLGDRRSQSHQQFQGCAKW